MELTFAGVVWEWRGPAPYHFVTVPPDEAAEIAEVARAVTYGWGMVPVEVRVGQTVSTTSLWPRAGGYVVPLKDALRTPEGIALDDVVTVTLAMDV
ncbi:DUF1905 domain-containing protein [Nocardioides sp. CFH 31398]|uniref:DUF1905 domain-containing protein n=1 Tax=Nocardioides sp. CFH 31398 TaxID=2919579 RepID=UPI001F053FFE|nr:DUF1905 domain-containing protein [Nocardioides sp. CFH 31398]MCH1867123.1 DUF1905 domain-containing protein [Nocardioides sp. CFH 31398]